MIVYSEVGGEVSEGVPPYLSLAKASVYKGLSDKAICKPLTNLCLAV